jgi:hypothetical protein
MKYIIRWEINTVVLLLGLGALYLFSPELIGRAYVFFYQLFGPWITVLFILVSSAPKRALRVKVVR